MVSVDFKDFSAFPAKIISPMSQIILNQPASGLHLVNDGAPESMLIFAAKRGFAGVHPNILQRLSQDVLLSLCSVQFFVVHFF